jgi:signal transduction histidine kinase
MHNEKILKMEAKILFYTVFLFLIILGFSYLLTNEEVLYITNNPRALCIWIIYMMKNSLEVVFAIVAIVLSGIILKKMIERKKEANYFLKKEAIYRQFFNQTSDPIIVFTSHKIISMNAAANYMMEEISLSLKKEECSILHSKSFKELMNRIYESSEPVDLSYKKVDGEEEKYYYNIKGFTGYSGRKKIGFAVFMKDVHQKHSQELISEYTESLNSEKTNFEILNKISHELRTPINILQGTLYNSINTVEHIEDKCIREKLMQDISIYDRNIRRMLKLSNSFISLMEISTSGKSLYFQNCDIINVTKSLSEASKEYAVKKKRNIEFVAEADELFCAVDVDKFEKMILNLLSNAIKFSKENSKILIKVKEKDRELKIDVCSEGKIIEEKQKENIFKLFKQGEHLLTRSNEGLGLGLRFVKQYAEMHRGRVEFKSTRGGNTIFTIKIPVCNYENIQQADSFIEAEICKQKVKVEFSDL